MGAMQQLEKPTDWYDLISQRLEILRLACESDAQGQMCGSVPPDDRFKKVQKYVEDMRSLAGFPKNLPAADVWLGPQGEIGLTWEFGDQDSIDLVFADYLTIRHTHGLCQEMKLQQDLPPLLAKLAA